MGKIKKAFTLAEILIALLIIGVVSSLVIPTIINDTQETEYTVAAKKIYADLCNAFNLFQGSFVNKHTNEDQDELLNSFCNVFVCVKRDYNANLFADNYKYFKVANDSDSPPYSARKGVMLSNGVAVDIFAYNDYAEIYVDINGKKNPNVMGVDFYKFSVEFADGAYNVYPFGMPYNDLDSIISSCNDSRDTICTGVRIHAPDKLPTTSLETLY